METDSSRKRTRPTRHANYAKYKPCDYLQKGPPGLLIKEVDYIEDPSLNRGLFTNRAIEKNEFVINYRGKQTNNTDTPVDTYIYEYHWKGKQYFIDARNANSGLGRFMNDIDRVHHGNCKPVVTELPGGEASIISFYSTMEIQCGKFPSLVVSKT